MDFIHQVAPWLSDKEPALLNQYLRSGGWLTEFQKTEEFEKLIADFLKVKYVIATNNGTVALYLALKALGIKSDDEVIVPDFTMIATPNAVLLAGAKPVFADIEENSLCLDPEKLPRTRKTKALIHVSLNGRAGNIDTIKRWCAKHDIHFIEDACQAFTSKHQGRFLGTLGEIGCFSMSPHKIITTGQGGFVVTNHRDLYERMKRLKDFGRLQGGADWHEEVGFNFKFTDVQAVLGIGQMANIKERISRKKRLFTLYEKELSGVSQITFLKTNLENTTPWFVDVVVPAKRRAALIAYLKGQGIGSRPFYPSVNSQPIFKGYSKKKFPVSKRMSEEGVWLPSSPTLTKKEVQFVCRKIREFFLHDL